MVGVSKQARSSKFHDFVYDSYIHFGWKWLIGSFVLAADRLFVTQFFVNKKIGEIK